MEYISLAQILATPPQASDRKQNNMGNCSMSETTSHGLKLKVTARKEKAAAK